MDHATCDLCGATLDDYGLCPEGCDDDRCVDCVLSNCDGTGDACPCNYECH